VAAGCGFGELGGASAPGPPRATARIFVAVSNHFEGYAPHTVQRLGERLEMSIPMPDLAAGQGRGLSDDGQLELL